MDVRDVPVLRQNAFRTSRFTFNLQASGISTAYDMCCCFGAGELPIASYADKENMPFQSTIRNLQIRNEYPLTKVIPRPKIVSEPKETPSSENELETDEKKPEPKSPTKNLHQLIDDGKNMTNKDAVGETEAEAFQKVEQKPASEEAQSLPQQSTDGYRPTERNYQNNLFVNPSPSAPNQTLLDILDMMQTDAELVSLSSGRYHQKVGKMAIEIALLPPERAWDGYEVLRNYSLEIQNGIDAETRVVVTLARVADQPPNPARVVDQPVPMPPGFLDSDDSSSDGDRYRILVPPLIWRALPLLFFSGSEACLPALLLTCISRLRHSWLRPECPPTTSYFQNCLSSLNRSLKSSLATLSSKNISFASILPLLQSVIVGPAQSQSLISYFTALSTLHNALYFLRLVPLRMVTGLDLSPLYQLIPTSGKRYCFHSLNQTSAMHATDLPTATARDTLSVLVEAVSVAVGWRPRRSNQTELAPASQAEIVYVPPSQCGADRPSFPHAYIYIWYPLVYVTFVPFILVFDYGK
ncbi:hypothetical protein DAPPUDRAFT_106650 [Daphnia pulex]|uniref:Uncharacterized protein n=1 Tax=Daphnia pulex TaxID=6669 RepID=E9GUL9_DAPPU|nr:hypothetical protein DAPPUDRAFT_106650 [Daphnia pulex]|eukprot:EFX76751.1 hypothetical protein DAPPUDRAFT_106650 [Daphnia pulex]